MRCGTTKGAARIGAVSGGSPQIASDRPNPWIYIGVSTAAGACGVRRRLRTGLEWVVGNQFSQLGVRRAGRCSRSEQRSDLQGPVDLVHHDGCVEDGSPTVLPRQRLAFLLSSVLLSLKKVVDLAPVGKQSVEQVASGLPKLATVPRNHRDRSDVRRPQACPWSAQPLPRSAARWASRGCTGDVAAANRARDSSVLNSPRWCVSRCRSLRIRVISSLSIEISSLAKNLERSSHRGWGLD